MDNAIKYIENVIGSLDSNCNILLKNILEYSLNSDDVRGTLEILLYNFNLSYYDFNIIVEMIEGDSDERI